MNQRLEFIVRVGAGAPQEPPAFLGTGFLVAPDRVLTCRHLVQERQTAGHGAREPPTPEALAIMRFHRRPAAGVGDHPIPVVGIDL